MLSRTVRILLSPPVLLGVIAVAVILAVVSLVLMFAGPPAQAPETPPTAVFVVIPGLTATPTVATPTPILSPTAALTPSPLPGTIGIGSYVQVTGTGGGGLNIREAPGVDSEVRFLGFDAEVFEVQDGPVEKDGYTWWFLVTPVDETRNGWAAAAFLSPIDDL